MSNPALPAYRCAYWLLCGASVGLFCSDAQELRAMRALVCTALPFWMFQPGELLVGEDFAFVECCYTFTNNARLTWYAPRHTNIVGNRWDAAWVKGDIDPSVMAALLGGLQLNPDLFIPKIGMVIVT